MELKMPDLVMRFVRDETAATAIEYGLIVAGISVSIMAVIQGIGSRLTATLGSLQTPLR
jgi:pilus assembly protein Flp/PilA